MKDRIRNGSVDGTLKDAPVSRDRMPREIAKQQKNAHRFDRETDGSASAMKAGADPAKKGRRPKVTAAGLCKNVSRLEVCVPAEGSYPCQFGSKPIVVGGFTRASLRPWLESL